MKNILDQMSVEKGTYKWLVVVVSQVKIFCKEYKKGQLRSCSFLVLRKY